MLNVAERLQFAAKLIDVLLEAHHLLNYESSWPHRCSQTEHMPCAHTHEITTSMPSAPAVGLPNRLPPKLTQFADWISQVIELGAMN